MEFLKNVSRSLLSSTSSDATFNINMALVLTTPEQPPKARFESPEGLV